MEEFVPLVALVSLVMSVVNLIKFIRARQLDPALTTIAVWIAGVVSVVLAAQTSYASEFQFGSVTLGEANFWTQVFIGLTFGAIGTVADRFTKAIDSNQTAATPTLVSKPVTQLPDGPGGHVR